MKDIEDPKESILNAFESLPRRIFLDSSTLQTLQDYGEFIWDNVEIPPHDKIHKIPNGIANIEALRAIFFVNQRANFDFALSPNSLSEVIDKGDRRYLQWAYDVLDHWEACLESYEDSPFSGEGRHLSEKLRSPMFGYLSKKDRALIQDVLILECEAFLTMEQRLPKNEKHIRRELGIQILRPLDYWELLKPWAQLYV